MRDNSILSCIMSIQINKWLSPHSSPPCPTMFWNHSQKSRFSRRSLSSPRRPAIDVLKSRLKIDILPPGASLPEMTCPRCPKIISFNQYQAAPYLRLALGVLKISRPAPFPWNDLPQYVLKSPLEIDNQPPAPFPFSPTTTCQGCSENTLIS